MNFLSMLGMDRFNSECSTRNGLQNGYFDRLLAQFWNSRDVPKISDHWYSQSLSASICQQIDWYTAFGNGKVFRDVTERIS
jgi:hypothetical protein